MNFKINLNKKSNKPGQFCLHVHVMLLNVTISLTKSCLWDCWFVLLSSDCIVQKTSCNTILMNF